MIGELDYSNVVCVVALLIRVQTDTHYAVLSLLLLLANSPTNAEYQQPTTNQLPGVVFDPTHTLTISVVIFQ